MGRIQRRQIAVRQAAVHEYHFPRVQHDGPLKEKADQRAEFFQHFGVRRAHGRFAVRIQAQARAHFAI